MDISKLNPMLCSEKCFSSGVLSATLEELRELQATFGSQMSRSQRSLVAGQIEARLRKPASADSVSAQEWRDGMDRTGLKPRDMWGKEIKL